MHLMFDWTGGLLLNVSTMIECKNIGNGLTRNLPHTQTINQLIWYNPKLNYYEGESK